VAPAATCDSNDGSNTTEDRCKSPTSGKPSPKPECFQRSFFMMTKSIYYFKRWPFVMCRIYLTLQFWRWEKTEVHREGYCIVTRCTSADVLSIWEKGKKWLQISDLSFLNLISSEVKKQTLFQDGCQWLWYGIIRMCSPLITHTLFSLIDGPLNAACASRANERRAWIPQMYFH